MSLLVVDNQRNKKGGGYALSRSKKALKTGYGLSTVPMFWLVPQVRVRTRLGVSRIVEGESRRMAELIDREFRRLDKAGRA